MVYISEALLNQADSKSIKLFEVIARVEFSSRPIVSQPREVTAYRVHIFLALLFWIGVVKSEIDQAIVLVCKSKGEANGRNSEDLIELQDLIKKHSDYKIPIIAKIEKPEAIENIDKIIAYCDGLMVARGDLGVEVPAAEVPLIQKNLVLKAKQARIPVIIATQMMETMIDSLTPTRAEVNDVANSVMDGADAVMLSGETSVGDYPVQVIETMTSILKSVEDSSLINVPQTPPNIRTPRFITKSVCYHAAVMANEINAKAICTLTNSGYTAFQISAWRPSAAVLVFTSNKRILSQLNLLWGVKAFYYDRFESTDNTVEEVNKIVEAEGFVKKGDMLINLAAMPIIDKGMVNTLRVSLI